MRVFLPLWAYFPLPLLDPTLIQGIVGMQPFALLHLPFTLPPNLVSLCHYLTGSIATLA